MTLPLPIATLLEMAAHNNGFDRELPPVDGWLGFGSTKAGRALTCSQPTRPHYGRQPRYLSF